MSKTARSNTRSARSPLLVICVIFTGALWRWGQIAIAHDFFYKKPEGHSNEENRKIALIVLGGGLLLTCYFLLALLLRRNFIVEDATSLFLFDYMKSWNAAPYIVSLMANVPPLVAWLFALGKPKEKPQQNQGEAVQKPAETPEKIS